VTGIKEMASAEVFKEFYAKLVKALPMNDALFIAELVSNDLLPGDLEEQLESQKTSADKATHFLKRVIKPSVSSRDSNSFDKLLNVMEDSEYEHVKELTKLIRTSLRKRLNSENS